MMPLLRRHRSSRQSADGGDIPASGTVAITIKRGQRLLRRATACALAN